jgi:uncharacterized protein (TIGR02001 family)
MRNPRSLAALSLLTLSVAAHAAEDAADSSPVTATVFGVSDYDFRGSSQNARDPALQASIDYEGDNGLTVGAWASNVDFGAADVDLEVDVYGSFSGAINQRTGWNTGVAYYAYPDDNDFNYVEIYGGLTYDEDLVSAKLWYSDKLLGDDGEAQAMGADTSAFYIEGNVRWPVPKLDQLALLLHVGLSTGNFWDNVIGDDVLDYSVGIGYATGKFDLELKFIANDTGDVDEIDTDVFSQEDRVLFSIKTTFPWSK